MVNVRNNTEISNSRLHRPIITEVSSGTEKSLLGKENSTPESAIFDLLCNYVRFYSTKALIIVSAIFRCGGTTGVIGVDSPDTDGNVGTAMRSPAYFFQNTNFLLRRL